MTPTDFDKYLAGAVVPTDGSVTLGALEMMLLPFFDPTAMTTHLMAACVITVTDASLDPSGSPTSHTTVVGYYEPAGAPEYVLLCGEKFLESRDLSEPDARKRCTDALEALPSAVQARLLKDLMSHYGSCPTSDARCQFYLNFRRKKEICKHVSATLAYLRDNVSDFQDQLVQMFSTAISGTAPAGTKSQTMSLEELVFRTPVLLEGDRGAGKTTDARTLARAQGCWLVEAAGHESVEAVELLGFLMQNPEDGRLVWKDGPLSEAVRRAGSGTKVVLLLDELLRIPTRMMSVLLTFLSPFEGRYWLRTGRAASVTDGVATEEMLSCPVENLAVIATTNVGAAYAVDDMDEAIRERFTVLRQDTELSKLAAILKSVGETYGNTPVAVKTLLKFFDLMGHLKQRGQVASGPTTRTLTRALELSGGRDEDMLRALRTLALLWVDRDTEGRPVPEQMEAVNEAIDDAYKDSTKTKRGGK